MDYLLFCYGIFVKVILLCAHTVIFCNYSYYHSLFIILLVCTLFGSIEIIFKVKDVLFKIIFIIMFLIIKVYISLVNSLFNVEYR